MNHYVLQPEDEIGVLPPGEEEAVIRVFCERTMVFFAVSQLESVTRQENVRTGSGPQTCQRRRVSRLSGSRRVMASTYLLSVLTERFLSEA